jgi:exonuclease V gamma subunit
MEQLPPAVDLAPLLAKMDTLINALNAHTVAVYQWADSCNALLNVMLDSAESEDDFITDLKGNRIPIHATTHADSTTKP